MAMAVVEKPAASEASTSAKPLQCEHRAHHYGAAACLHAPPTSVSSVVASPAG
jgi:hypothetical protein